MVVYRILHSDYAGSLISSGRAGRWNSEGNYVIYTSQNKSLACLENVVHRSAASLSGLFSIMEIEIPAPTKIKKVEEKQLIGSWRSNDRHFFTHLIGDEWYVQRKTLLLKVPSAIVSGEFNFVINTLHPDFKKIRIKSVQKFDFDSRIKN